MFDHVLYQTNCLFFYIFCITYYYGYEHIPLTQPAVQMTTCHLLISQQPTHTYTHLLWITFLHNILPQPVPPTTNNHLLRLLLLRLVFISTPYHRRGFIISCWIVSASGPLLRAICNRSGVPFWNKVVVFKNAFFHIFLCLVCAT